MKQHIVVVGAGHAGLEAALAAARLGAQVSLVTHRADRVGEMSCNPAFGGVGKGHLIREIDALDGVMGRCADAAAIHFRLLNRRKGAAVQGPRVQADRVLYRDAAQRTLAVARGVRVVEAAVEDVIDRAGRACGVRLATGSEVEGDAVVLTTGTFLGGVIHLGQERIAGGRIGDAPANGLATRLRGLGLPLARLKTGTPPRLDGRTIAWDRVEPQPSDDEPALLSFLSTGPVAKQVSCGVTRTTAETHEIIRRNISSSALYSGHISGAGPRYCPSIEDKVVRFADKDSHTVFLEPEGLTTDWVYPNGISTSLPVDVQDAYVRSIPGLERAVIEQPGYAIEYDYVDPRALTAALELRALPNLFLAGQINGTTGYEEAGAQGLVAGLNAVLLGRGQERVPLDRTNSYIGVMIDDLVTRGVTEPYRMFTSRAEFRLALRADNADQRLTPLGLSAGCIGAEREAMFEAKLDRLERARTALSRQVTPSEARAAGLEVNQDGIRRSGLELLGFPEVSMADLQRLWPDLDVDTTTSQQIATEAHYAPYIARQAEDVARVRASAARSIPADFDYDGLPGLSGELQGKLVARQPRSLREAEAIEGMTPAALALIVATLQRDERKRA